jgi:branched-chain amino acid transport system permease protein
VQQFLNYSFSGLTSAAIYAIAATGLVLTYTTTGVFNFAHGAMGMFAAFGYWELRFGWHLPAPIALIISLLVLAPLFGILLEIVIMRGLEGTSETTKLMVSVSVLLALLGAALWIWDPNKSRPFPKFWEGKVVVIAHVRLPYHQVAALLIAGLVAIGLRLLLYRTRAGVSMRASVDDRGLARLNGARPAASAMLAWAIGSSLAALAGILIAPTLSLSALPLTLLIVNAYAAAMIGRLRSLPMTFVGALILGLANDYARGYLTRIHTGQQYIQGFIDTIPIIILFIVLLVLPQARLRGHRVLRTRELAPLPTWRGSLTFCGCVLAGTAMLSGLLGKADLVSSSKIWGIAIIGLSIIPLVGFAGQISLCQLSFAGIGAVVVAHLGNSGNPLALLWAAVIAGLVGALVALPALRLSGIYLALSTAAFAVAMDRWIFPLPRFTIFGHRFDLFQSGSLTIHRTRLFGLKVEGDKAYFIFGAVAFCLLALLVVYIRRSNFGQRLLAMKDSPAACATLGLNLTYTKLAVFATSAAIAGLGGAIYGGAIRTAPGGDSGVFQFFAGLTILMLMVIGGINSIGAALFGGIFVGVPLISNLQGHFHSLKQLPTVLPGLAGIGLGKNPNGFIVSDIRPRWEVVFEEPAAIAILLATLFGIWVLRVMNVITNWPFALLCLAVLAVGPLVGEAVRARRLGGAAPVVARLPAAATAAATIGNGATSVNGAPELSAPLEWLGITTPYRPEDIAVMDRVLALPDMGPDGAA